MNRLIFIGDIHGCLKEFQELVDVVAPTETDRVICVGDFMDKGPEPAACVRFARERGFESVLGNHEERHLRWRRHQQRQRVDPTYQNPMRSFTPEDLFQNSLLDEEDLQWLSFLPLYLRPLHNLVVVHGGLLPGLALDAQPEDKILRARWLKPNGEFIPYDHYDQHPDRQHWTALYDGPYDVVYGHEAFSLMGPKIDRGDFGTYYGIDTGCVYGGHLTALVWVNGFWGVTQVKAKKTYAKSLHEQRS